MKGSHNSKLVRQGQALVALTLATVALVWLLGMWGGIPPVEARGPAMAGTAGDGLRLSATSMMTIYLPILFKSDIVFFDDFSSTSSGWLHNKTFDSCEVGYNSGRYRVKVSGSGQRCIIHNGNVPKQVNGTFKIRVRRTSSSSYPLLYGFLFGSGSDAAKNHWALEVYPNKDSNCSNKPFFWLVALVNDSRKFFQDECTDAIDTDQSDWNELKVIRNGSNIKVYINGQKKGDYNNASYLLNEGYFSLEVVSGSSSQIVVEYDDLEIRSSVTSP
jgi:hypothetical protein